MHLFIIPFLVIIILLVIIAVIFYNIQTIDNELYLSMKTNITPNLNNKTNIPEYTDNLNNKTNIPEYTANLNNKIFELYTTDNQNTYHYKIDMDVDSINVHNLYTNELIYELNGNNGIINFNPNDIEILNNNGFYINVNKYNEYYSFELSSIINKV